MRVSYKKLWIKLVEKDMSKADLRKAADITPSNSDDTSEAVVPVIKNN